MHVTRWPSSVQTASRGRGDPHTSTPTLFLTPFSALGAENPVRFVVECHGRIALHEWEPGLLREAAS